MSDNVGSDFHMMLVCFERFFGRTLWMKSCHTLIHLATLIGLTASVCGQVAVKSSQTSSTDALQDLKPGVVVEEVKKNSAADQARIQAGDVILSWSRGDAKGQIESPFDVSLIEI